MEIGLQVRIEDFGEFKTGQLKPIRPGGRVNDYAFVPDSLPAALLPDSSLWQLIAEARDRVGTLNGIGGVLPAPGLLLRPLQRREAIKSNSIEGTYVTPEELLLFELEQNKERGPDTQRRDDWREVAAYDWALIDGVNMVSTGERIDKKLICHLHRQLMQGVRGKDKRPGHVRDIQVYVEAGRRFIPPPAEYLESLLSNFEDYLQSESGDPLVRAFISHYQFEAIHPFLDGNGRLGRLLLSLCVYKWLNHSHAWLYLSEFFDKNRKEYIRRLYAVSASGEWNEWIKFCLIGAIERAEFAISTCKRLNDLKREYESRVGHLSKRINAIISGLLCDPFIEASELARRLGISYNSAKRDIDKLMEHNVLKEWASTRRKIYCAHEVFSAAYDD